jgi:hypothetical protein
MKPEGITTRQWIRYNFYLGLQHLVGFENSKTTLHRWKQNLYQEILQNPGIENRGKVYTTEDVSVTNFDFSKHSDLMTGPIVFKGVAKDWPCISKWNKKFFRENHADYNISLVGNVGLADKENQNKYKVASMGDFIDNLSKDKHNYLRFSRIIDERPELREDMDVKWLDQFKSKFARGGYLYLFMGEEGSKTDMHTAIIQTLFVQIKGKKKWTIYAPNERLFVDGIADRRPYFYSQANPNKLDDPNYPLLKHAKRYEIILDEGDVMWFPTFYWHYVENLTENIGVTYQFTEFGESFKLSKAMTTLFFLATRPTLLESFYYNTFKKRDLLFDAH